MQTETWRALLVAALSLNAALGFGYRVYRLAKGGPLSDVLGQAVLAVLLVGVAIGSASGWAWARWGALAYGLLFGIIVMPLWTLAVLIPLRPRGPDYLFTSLYWAGLLLTVVAALAL